MWAGCVNDVYRGCRPQCVLSNKCIEGCSNRHFHPNNCSLFYRYLLDVTSRFCGRRIRLKLAEQTFVSNALLPRAIFRLLCNWLIDVCGSSGASYRFKPGCGHNVFALRNTWLRNRHPGWPDFWLNCDHLHVRILWWPLVIHIRDIAVVWMTDLF